MIELTFYAVRNKEGKWFRAKGYGGYGETWVDNVEKARIYPKIGSARRQVSFFALNYPQYGVPELVKLSVTNVEIIDETDRVQKQRVKKVEREAREKKNQAKYRVEQAQKALDDAQRRFDEVKRRNAT